MRSPWIIASLVTAVVACSGKTENTTTTPAPTGNGTVTAQIAGCPATDPGEGTACSKNDQVCEVGDDYNPACNVMRVCSSGRWATPITYGKAKCPGGIPSVGPNASDCPASPLGGQACSTSSVCAYGDTTCACANDCSNYPVAQPDCNPDAGINPPSCCERSKTTWHCGPKTKYCALPRPRLGSACTTEGDSCAIDVSDECSTIELSCQSGKWSLRVGTCPVSSRAAKEDIRYVDRAEADRLHDDLQRVKLATYRYKSEGDARRLGFVIEDMPASSPAVLPTRDRVDLYGYMSMAVAAIQHQQREIDALKAEVAVCRAQPKK